MHETVLLERLVETTNSYSSWSILRQAVQDGRTVHLAVMVEPFLSYILDGTKSIESRFSKHSIAPFYQIKSGDLVLLKLTGGPVVGCFDADTVEFMTLNKDEHDRLRRHCSAAICADDDFWHARQDKRYATLVGVRNVHVLDAAPVAKSDPPRLGRTTAAQGEPRCGSVDFIVTWLICLSGGIASGKTTLAEALQVTLPSSARLAFGDVVRRRALAAKREPTRQNLQEIGLQLIAEGWSTFVDDLLSDLTSDPEVLIVEGIRHLEAVDALTERLPTRKLLLIYLEIDSDQQRRRLTDLGETEGILDHEVERDVGDVRAAADLVVSTERPVEELVARVRQILER